MAELEVRRGTAQRAGLVAGPLCALAILYFAPGLRTFGDYDDRPAYAAAVTAMMAVFWLTEAIPIALTATLPLLLFPAFGVFGKGFVSDLAATARPFLDAYVLLFFGGMSIGAAMEETGLHRRIALGIMARLGAEPQRLLLGMLVATAFVSAWISNTATAVMMLPIAIAVTKELETSLGGRRLTHFGCALMLAVAYASNIGGIGTKIGTGTNSIFAGFISDRMSVEIDFLLYSAVAFPFVILFMPLTWAVLWQVARQDRVTASSGRAVLERERMLLGAPSWRERRVAYVFVAAAGLWTLGDVIRPALAPLVTPWIGFSPQGKHYEAAVALTAAASLIMLRTLSRRALLSMPYASLLLLGGSLSMAGGIEGSGLSVWLSERLRVVATLPLPSQLFIASSATVLLSAIASNTATINVLLNVLPQNVVVLFASAMGASCDFMLPAGTPPNAIVFGSGYVRLRTMVRVGFVLDVVAAVLIALYMMTYGRYLLE